MATLAGVVAMTHNPRIFWNAEAASERDRAAVDDAFARARDVIEASRPDLVIAVANDHLDQFGLDAMPSFAVGVADRVAGPFWYENEIMRLPHYDGPGDPGLGEDILFTAVESGIEPTRCERFGVDHAFTVPLSVTLPGADVPVVPVFVNTFGPPLPTSGRCFRLGEVLREVIAARPAGERIAVVGSFNLSVEVGGPAMGRRHRDFDDSTLELIANGAVDELTARSTPAYLVRHGNSTAEFLNYLVIAGVVGDRRPDLTWYELVDGWGGCPVVAWSSPHAPATPTSGTMP